MTLQIKLILAGILLGLIGYSYYWTYDQGRKNGKNNEIVVQYEALKKLMIEQQLEFNDLRAKEMREARKIQEDFKLYHQRKVKELEAANEILRKQPPDVQVCLAQPVDPVLIRLLNDAGAGSDSTS